LVENLRERDHLGDPGVDGRVIWRWQWFGGYGLDRGGSGEGRWWTHGNEVTNLQVP
jgi:hypothetical protein